MNMSVSFPSAPAAGAFFSRTRNLRRVITWGAFSLLPAMFAANSPPPVVKPEKQPVDVQVINTEAAPVQTQDVDNPAFQPFQLSQILTFPVGLLGSNADFTVPAGKRLVIEFVSFQLTMPSGQKPTFNFITIDNPGQATVTFSFPMLSEFNAGIIGGVNSDVFIGTSLTRLYANPGSKVTLSVRRNAVIETGLATVSLAGYYVNVP
jgi:hypothetical protein